MKHEFDNHIDNYRKKLDQSLALSGETSNFFAKYKAQKLFEWFPQFGNTPCTILDYGCGDGNMTHHVKNVFSKAKLHGIDPSLKSIKKAAQTHPSLTFDTLTNNTMPYPKNTFDLVYAAGVFHHIPFAQHAHYLDQIMCVLKPGGFFVLFELNPYNPLTRKTFNNCPIDKDATMLSPRYAKKLLPSSTTKYYFFFPAMLKKLRVLEKHMTWLPLGALYASIVEKK